MKRVSLPAWHPRWSGCPVYESACGWANQVNGAVDGVQLFDPVKLRAELAQARVLKVTREQVEAVCADMTVGDWHELAMPFDPTFIEIENPGYGCQFPSGFLVIGQSLVPFVRRNVDRPFHVMGIGATTQVNLDAEDSMNSSMLWMTHDLPEPQLSSLRQQLGDWMVASCGLVLAVDYLLRSTNVALGEEPVSRQVRRAAKREGRQIAFVVEVRRSRGSTKGAGETVDYSHRFEVRGHFQHHFKGPVFEKCKDPQKRIVVDGAECVRVWNPGCVKGSDDKPFVPKVRDARKLIGGAA